MVSHLASYSLDAPLFVIPNMIGMVEIVDSLVGVGTLLRRVVLEMSRKDLLPQEAEEFKKLESFRVVHLLRQDPDSYAGICNIRPSPNVTMNDLIGVAGFTTVQLLSEETDGSLTVFISGRPRREWFRPRPPADGFHYPPFELEGDKWRMTFLGTKSQVQKILAKLDKRGLRYRIVYSGDARFAPVSVLSALTGKQRRAIMAAYSRGYFDFPRRIKSKELAQSLGISQSTLTQHLMIAQKKILDNITSSNPRVSQ